jgi:UDP-N-acetyl-D-glucosamine dehydrogenase
LQIAEALAALGAAVHATDPHVLRDQEPGDIPLVRVELTADEVARADAVVLVTDHSAFDYSFVQQHASYVLDTRHRIPPGPNVEYL